MAATDTVKNDVLEIDNIKNDLKDLNEQAFIEKYFFSEGNWYFTNFLELDVSDAINQERLLKEHIKDTLNLSATEVFMVGSGKIGISLSPKKLFQPFRIDSDSTKRKPSDIDIAIISDEIYHEYWSLFRKSYSPRYSYSYGYISREIYRGYINEKNIHDIPPCRKEWILRIKKLKRILSNHFKFQHEVTYRIYRNKNDFLEYVSQNLSELKRGI